MSCQETREKLSALADNELAGEELQRVRGHLAGCSSCRHELQEQGALDMLLRSCFIKEPPATTLEGIWPTVEERLDGGEGKANGGGTAREGEIVFKSSSAMQMLRIPEGPPPAAAASAPSAAPPARSGWVWPTAMVVSAAILAGGFVLYKRMTPPPTLASQDAVARATVPDAGAQVAAAPSSQEAVPGAASEPATDPGPELTTDRKVAAAPRAKRASKALKVAAAKGAAPEPKPAAAEAKAEPKEPAAKPARKKGDDLDNLIDDAIGGSGQPIPKKKKEEAAPKAPAEDLPEQLTMNQIRTSMNKVKGQVQACYDKYQIEGEARVTFTISSDGSVGDCGIKGKFFGTDTGTCVVAAVKKARFPKFSGKAMTINNYPFLLQ